MTEQFGTAVKRKGQLSNVALSPSYQIAKDVVDVVNGIAGNNESERLVVVRVQEVDSTEPRE